MSSESIVVKGFITCKCGKLHMLSWMMNVCPKCGISLRKFLEGK